jgi:hypothetical protein
MVTRLHGDGELGEADLEDYTTTFMASIFRSIRFGSASAHGVANLIRFNFFEERGAFTRDAASGTYRADYEKLREVGAGVESKRERFDPGSRLGRED